MLSLGTLPINKPEDLVERFYLCVDGALNESTLGFLHSINKANPFGLADLITKLQHIQVKPNADMIHKAVQALTDQLKIPHNAVQIIQDFLQEDGKQGILSELQTLEPAESKLHQSIFHIMDNLNIYTGDGLAEQFMRTVISIMLEWDAKPQRTVKDAAKWLRAVFNIPHKSIMAQIIQLIADHLHLSDCIIAGKTRNMDCLELFFLLKNLTNHTDMVLVAETNKPFMLQINATVLAVMIYKNSQNAFYDVVTWHEQHPNFSILTELNAHHSAPMVIEKFLQSDTFKPYFSQQRYQDSRVNQHIFMSSLAEYMRTVIESDSSYHDLNMEKIVSFTKQCNTQFRDKDTIGFLEWYQDNPQFEALEPLILSLLFNTLQTMALTQKSRHAGRIRASAMQLVTLGYSHRSASTLTTGVFKPMVNIDIAAIDTANITAMIAFFNQQTQTIRLKLLQEIFLGYIIYNQSLQLSYQNKNKAQSTNSKTLALLNAPKFKSMPPQMLRANPMNRNRMFTPKSTLNNVALLYDMVATSSTRKPVETLTSHSPFETPTLGLAPLPFTGFMPMHSPASSKGLKRKKRALARRLAKKRACLARSPRFC